MMIPLALGLVCHHRLGGPGQGWHRGPLVHFCVGPTLTVRVALTVRLIVAVDAAVTAQFSGAVSQAMVTEVQVVLQGAIQLVLSCPDGPCLLLVDDGLELLVPAVIHTTQRDGGCEKVVAVLPQLLGLSIEAAGAAVGGRSQPLAQGFEALAALGGAEDYNGVVLHVVEALNC